MFKIQIWLTPNSKEMLTEQECKYRNAFALTLLVSAFTIYSVSLTCVIKLILQPFLASRKRENTSAPTKCENYLLNLRHSLVIYNEYMFIWNYNRHISPSICSFSSHKFIHLPRSFYYNLYIYHHVAIKCYDHSVPAVKYKFSLQSLIKQLMYV